MFPEPESWGRVCPAGAWAVDRRTQPPEGVGAGEKYPCLSPPAFCCHAGGSNGPPRTTSQRAGALGGGVVHEPASWDRGSTEKGQEGIQRIIMICFIHSTPDPTQFSKCLDTNWAC